ncbi:MAG: MaoC family dehydratase [Kiloniellales bacterium]|nr:MaoC family dehydratase [Kiloniellales bacterium]
MSRTDPGNFFEDFIQGVSLSHGPARTVTEGEQALYTALYGSRFAVQASTPAARKIGYERAPLDDLLVFHCVFGQSVADISLNAVANLGYANCRFLAPVYPGDTLSAISTVIGLKENSNRKTGVVYVRTEGFKEDDERVLDYIRWVMVRKRDPEAEVGPPRVPELPGQVTVDKLVMPTGVRITAENAEGGAWEDYRAGDRFDHQDGMTIEEAEHQMATRLYHNTARVHFNHHVEKDGRFGRRIVYGGHVISIARALSYNGLSGAFHIVAINGGSHTAPSFAGDTIYAWSEILEKLEIPGRNDLGALRVRTVATKDRACGDFPYKDSDGNYDPAVVLDLDYVVLLPRCWWRAPVSRGAGEDHNI